MGDQLRMERKAAARRSSAGVHSAPLPPLVHVFGGIWMRSHWEDVRAKDSEPRGNPHGWAEGECSAQLPTKEGPLKQERGGERGTLKARVSKKRARVMLSK